MPLLDMIWTALSYATSIGSVIAVSAPLGLIFYLLYKVRKDPSFVADDDSHVMSLLEAMSYDDYAEDYFNGEIKLCENERWWEIWKLFGRYLFVALLAKSFVAVISLTILYAVMSISDSFLMHYYFKNYWEKIDEPD